jgi:ribosomal protein S12 methylthiotransferase
MISLGCAKNLVDAEIMLGTLLKEGLEVINDAAEADVVIVNTCSFIDTAQEESIDTILQSAALREIHHRGQGLVVSGCLSQRFREQLPKLLPEVDVFMGIDQVAEVAHIVREAFDRRRRRLSSPPAKTKAKGKRTPSRPSRRASIAAERAPLDVTRRPTYIPDYATPRFRLTPKHFAYVKIAEGCNHPCSFCIIPRMRGSHRSRTQPDVVEEVRGLVSSGVREINLISQDTTYYGLDLHPRSATSLASPQKFAAATRGVRADAPSLVTLLRELNRLSGDFWIRLLYTHPAHWTDELIRTIADCPKVARYVDMPLQHIHPVMLERMRRETSRAYIEDLIGRIRAGIRGITLRTTFIVGFPGETDACYESLLEFIRATRFERLGVFTYSQEEGTRAARMSEAIPDRLKAERRDRAMAEQQLIARAHAAAQVGQTLRVLLEQQTTAKELSRADVSSWEHGLVRAEEPGPRPRRGRWTVARGEGDAPDIDGRVYVRGHLPPGGFVPVRVVKHGDYDLIAEPFRD